MTDDLEGLSDEERAALDESEDEVPVTEDAEPVEAEAKAEPDPEPEPKPEPKAEPEPEPEPKAELEPEPEPKAEPLKLRPTQQLVAEPLPENYTEQLADITAALDDIATQHDRGDLTFAEAQKAQTALMDQRSELISLRRNHEFVQRNNEQLWVNLVEGYFVDNPELSSTAHRAAYTALVSDLANDAANSNQPWEWYIRQAGEQLQTLFAPKIAPPQAPAQSPAQTPAIPKTLGGLPTADTETLYDKNAHLDQLEGLELEAQLARMTPEQAANYLNGG